MKLVIIGKRRLNMHIGNTLMALRGATSRKFLHSVLSWLKLALPLKTPEAATITVRGSSEKALWETSYPT